MYKFRDTNYEKKYVKSGGGYDDVYVYYCIPDTELGKFLNLKTRSIFCFGKLGDSLKDSTYYPVLFSEKESLSFCEKVIQTYKSNWSISSSFCVFGMLILKFKIDTNIISSVKETSFEQLDASMVYDSAKMKDPIIKYKAQSSEDRQGLISCKVMDEFRNNILTKPHNTKFDVYYHVDDELNKSCFTMFNLLNSSVNMTAKCLKILQVLFENKNNFVDVNQNDVSTHQSSLLQSLVPVFIHLKSSNMSVVSGGKRKSKKHSKLDLQKGGKTEIKMKKQYDDLVKEYYALKKQARSKNII